jgi:hypothetical protein
VDLTSARLLCEADERKDAPMPLSPMDELLAHQTCDTFDHVFTSNRNFYDRYYFNMPSAASSSAPAR